MGKTRSYYPINKAIKGVSIYLFPYFLLFLHSSDWVTLWNDEELYECIPVCEWFIICCWCRSQFKIEIKSITLCCHCIYTQQNWFGLASHCAQKKFLKAYKKPPVPVGAGLRHSATWIPTSQSLFRKTFPTPFDSVFCFFFRDPTHLYVVLPFLLSYQIHNVRLLPRNHKFPREVSNICSVLESSLPTFTVIMACIYVNDRRGKKISAVSWTLAEWNIPSPWKLEL